MPWSAAAGVSKCCLRRRRERSWPSTPSCPASLCPWGSAPASAAAGTGGIPPAPCQCTPYEQSLKASLSFQQCYPSSRPEALKHPTMCLAHDTLCPLWEQVGHCECSGGACTMRAWRFTCVKLRRLNLCCLATCAHMSSSAGSSVMPCSTYAPHLSCESHSTTSLRSVPCTRGQHVLRRFPPRSSASPSLPMHKRRPWYV